MTAVHPRLRGKAFSFMGSMAVQRRLESCGMVVGKIQMVSVSPSVWEAETDHGTRWVSRTAAGAWLVSRTALGR